MGVALVVSLAEGFDDDGGLPHAVEGFLVEAFVPEPGVEALGLAVLPGLAGIDEVGVDAQVADPEFQVDGDEL